MIRRLQTVLLVLMFCLASASASYADEYIPVENVYLDLGVVECPKYLNIRHKPDKDSKVVGIVKTGAGCTVLQEGQIWCAVKSGDISGYVLKEYLLTGDAALNKARELATRKIKFKSPGVVYSSMNTNSKVWERPVTGTSYDVAEDTGTWIRIDLDGATGYVLADSSIERYWGLDTANYTYDVSNLEGTRRDLVKYAMQFLGNKYVWGGNDPHTGADCSGFVRYVYSHNTDVYLPRVSYEQCYSGRKITSMEMRPGDLIFYADSSGTVGHVAMYIGNGTIIHAASQKSGIKLSAWNYRTPKFIRNVLED